VPDIPDIKEGPGNQHAQTLQAVAELAPVPGEQGINVTRHAANACESVLKMLRCEAVWLSTAILLAIGLNQLLNSPKNFAEITKM
jgi:hypothetical protein